MPAAITLERRVLGEPDALGGGVGAGMTREEAYATLVGLRDTLAEATTAGTKLLAKEAEETAQDEADEADNG